MILLSLLPASVKQALHTTGRWHSAGHLLIFCVIGYFTARTSRSLRSRLVLFGAVVMVGFAIELSEHIMFGAPLEWNDILVDTAGAVLGTGAAILGTWRRRRTASMGVAA